jgi:hypothetical protein
MTKEELIEKYRDINVAGDWWYESIYDWFEKECKKRGVNILHTNRHMGNGKSKVDRDISWSGFWSQGDGAAFSGKVVDMDKALGNYYVDYPILHKYVEELDGYWNISWRVGNGNNICINDIEFEPISHHLEDDHPFVELWQEQLEKEFESVEPILVDLAEELCDLLYKALRDEYEHYTSDESVWDTIVANELDKEEE